MSEVDLDKEIEKLFFKTYPHFEQYRNQKHVIIEDLKRFKDGYLALYPAVVQARQDAERYFNVAEELESELKLTKMEVKQTKCELSQARAVARTRAVDL